MKRLLALFLTVLLLFSFSACSSSDTQSSSDKPANQPTAAPKTPTQAQENTVPRVSATPEFQELSPSGDLGDYSVEIGELETIQDYDGNPAILIGLSFTNNSSENASVSLSLLCNAYQNGVELETAFITDSSVYNAQDSLKNVQPGGSISLKQAYSLTSDTAPVEFEVSEAFSFNGNKIGKTFEISDGGVTVLSTAPSGSISGEINGFTVSIISYDLTKDYEGKNAILFELGFTNNIDSSTSFMASINVSAFQDGVELETAFITEDATGHHSNSMLSVKPGAGLPVSVVFVLSNDTSPVQVEIGDLFGFSSDKIETEITIA